MNDWFTIMFGGAEGVETFINFALQFLLAFIVFLLGWLFAVGVGKIVQELLKRLQLDKITQIEKWEEALEKAEFDSSPSEFIGAICKWILIIVFLSIAVEILGLAQFSAFLNEVIIWLPNLLVAILIFVATVILASFAEKLVRASVHGAKVSYSRLAGAITKWAIWIFGISAVLMQLLPQVGNLILVLVQGIIAFIVVAGGLAFGLGGKEVAGDVLKDLREKFSKD